MKNNYILYVNIINPILWSIILIYFMYKIKRKDIRLHNNREHFRNMIIILSIFAVIYFYLGFIFGFSKSPYNHGIVYIVKNIIVQILPIIGIEITRYIIINKNRKSKIKVIFITILLILIEINYNKILTLYTNKIEFFEYICVKIIPTIICGFLCTFLSLQGTYSLSLVYRIFKEGLIILLPILPNINWFIEGTIQVIFSAIVYGLYKYKFIKEDIRERKENFGSKFSFCVILALCVSLVCFCLGVFKYEPIVILSNSMIPTFCKGDIVIYKKINEEEIKELDNGTIIVYSIEDKNIAHRIVDVINNEENKKYRTKGDNNNVADATLVDINQVLGVYCFHIKYLGFPSVWLYE